MTNEKSTHNTLSKSPVKMCPKTHQQVHQVVYAGYFFVLQGTFTKKCDGCVLVEDGIVSLTMALANDPWY